MYVVGRTPRRCLQTGVMAPPLQKLLSIVSVPRMHVPSFSFVRYACSFALQLMPGSFCSKTVISSARSPPPYLTRLSAAARDLRDGGCLYSGLGPPVRRRRSSSMWTGQLQPAADATAVPCDTAWFPKVVYWPVQRPPRMLPYPGAFRDGHINPHPFTKTLVRLLQGSGWHSPTPSEDDDGRYSRRRLSIRPGWWENRRTGSRRRLSRLLTKAATVPSTITTTRGSAAAETTRSDIPRNTSPRQMALSGKPVLPLP